MINLYLISQDTNNDYNTYDAAVVAAKNEREAKNMRIGDIDTWTTPDKVKAKLIGITKRKRSGIILSSFNAG